MASHWVSSSEASNSWSDPDSLSITSKCSLDIDGRGLVHERRLRRIAKINTWITQCHLGREPVTESDLAHLIEVLGDRLCLWSRAVHHCVRTQPVTTACSAASMIGCEETVSARPYSSLSNPHCTHCSRADHRDYGDAHSSRNSCSRSQLRSASCQQRVRPGRSDWCPPWICGPRSATG